MKTPEIFGLIVKYLPDLISLAEGLFAWKNKAGGDKKAFVADNLKKVVTAVAAESTGGQKKTFEDLAPAIDLMIDGSVALANAAGAFKEPSQLDRMTQLAD